jgi:cell division cycle protein 20 (cofactor of APC complex)
MLIGSEYGSISLIDLRNKNTIGEISIGHHIGEVCNIRKVKESDLIITGGNDNKVQIFDLRRQGVIHILEHNSAVKALDYNVNNSTILTGGGTHDQTIRCYNLKTFDLIAQKSLDSQISNVFFLPDDLIISSQGYISNNIEILRYFDKKLKHKVSFENHNKRILYLVKSPCEKYAMSASTDGNVKLWNLFDLYEKHDSILDLFNNSIR